MVLTRTDPNGKVTRFEGPFNTNTTQKPTPTTSFNTIDDSWFVEQDRLQKEEKKKFFEEKSKQYGTQSWTIIKEHLDKEKVQRHKDFLEREAKREKIQEKWYEKNLKKLEEKKGPLALLKGKSGGIWYGSAK